MWYTLTSDYSKLLAGIVIFFGYIHLYSMQSISWRDHYSQLQLHISACSSTFRAGRIIYIYIYVYVDPLWKAWSFANAVSVNLGPKRCIEFKHDIICTFTLTLDVRNSLECVTPFCCIVWNRTESISQDCRLKRPSIVYNHRLKMPCNLDHWIGASYKPNWGQLMETKENVRNPYSTAAMSSWNQCLSCSFWAYELMKLQSPQRPFALSRIFVPKMSKCHKSTWFWVL